jgi:hypothetical protein
MIRVSMMGKLLLGCVLLAALAAAPLVSGCDSETPVSAVPTGSLAPRADSSRIAQEYGSTIFDEGYALGQWEQARQRVHDDYMNNLHDPLITLAGITGLEEYEAAASHIEDFADLIGAVSAYDYSQLIFHSGLTYDLKEGFEELANLIEASEDYSDQRARLRSELVRLRLAHIESYPSSGLAGSEEMKLDARAAARSAVDSAASFLDGLAKAPAAPQTP